jgi:hypothetical protein
MKTKHINLLAGLVAVVAVNASATVRYVNVNSASPLPPYTNWATASTDIQSAIDVATNGDLILVTDGVYQTGGRQRAYSRTTNRVAVTKPVAIQSVNGPAVTVIRGYQVPRNTNDDAAIRCAYLVNGASLSGFTLTNGATVRRGLDDGWGGESCVNQPMS